MEPGSEWRIDFSLFTSVHRALRLVLGAGKHGMGSCTSHSVHSRFTASSCPAPSMLSAGRSGPPRQPKEKETPMHRAMLSAAVCAAFISLSGISPLATAHDDDDHGNAGGGGS